MKDEIKEILEALKPQDEEFTKAGIKEYPLVLSIKEQKILLDCITNLQEENDYLKDIVSNTELSDEIKKADKWSKRELYKINYQRLQVNKRLREENERLNNEIKEKYIEWQVFDDVIGEISEILITKNVNFTKLELLKRRLLDKFYRY